MYIVRLNRLPPCSMEGCEKLAEAHGWCQMHYRRWMVHGDPLITLLPRGGVCCAENCERTAGARGLCRKHYKAKRRAEDPRELTLHSWEAMKARCLKPRAVGYKHYGGRGIAICERWLNSFEDFRIDMGERPPGLTLDRIDVNGNYEPGNCRWADGHTQRVNQRPWTDERRQAKSDQLRSYWTNRKLVLA